ncbi:MAG TPA: FmdB family zinc ribbon protein [Streptosporangiaceae bacterium]|nr:FmdB family zinc ribbon protein [Streptosporangiaceae bacterium]
MPTYQYTCTDCGEPVEAVQKFTDDPLTVCAVCGGRLRKVFSPVGIVFKGSGFYRTDSRNSSVAADAKKDKQDKQAAESAKKSGESSNGSADKAGKADKTAAKKSEPVSTASKSSGEKVA